MHIGGVKILNNLLRIRLTRLVGDEVGMSEGERGAVLFLSLCCLFNLN